MPKNVLLICGSLNQTTIMHKIASQMPENHCYFTPFYADGLLGWLAKSGLLNFTILGGRHRRNTERYLKENQLPVDWGGRSREYDLVITATDVLIQRNIRGKRLVLVQEGLMEPEGFRYFLVKYLKLPRFLANTASTGLSDAYDVFCVASAGYKALFIRKGVRPEKILVTGIPNFDNVESYLNNDFPHHQFVLAVTSNARETLSADRRVQFIQRARQVAAGRPLIFKLHPNENVERATQEIQRYAPEAMVYTDGNVNHMVANCAAMVTEYSSVSLVGVSLKKEIYADFDVEALRELAPVQNNGRSAQKIALISKVVLRTPLVQRGRLPQRLQRQLGV